MTDLYQFFFYGGIFIIAYVLYHMFLKKKTQNKESDSESDSGDQETIEKKEYTLSELKKYNGVDNKKIFVSIKGTGSFL
jgi:hypothetical protein